jgi:hypothetical protein
LGENRVSRRRMLKRIGAGAAVAWSAPILSSIRTPAFGQVDQYPDRCDPANCQFTCGGPVQTCGAGPVGIGCFCDLDASGVCRCVQDAPCGVLVDCGPGGFCAAGTFCIPSQCCGVPKCVFPCGVVTRQARTADGPTLSGH